MLIYNNDDLYNKHVHEQASEAFAGKSISEESYKELLATHPSNLYTPNYFIKIALGVLTLVAITFSGLLIALFSSLSSMSGVTILLLFFGILDYVVLELLVRKKHYYNAGIDNLLMFFVAANIVGAFVTNEYAGQSVMVSAVSMLVCVFLAARFSDGFMSILSYVAMFLFVFFLYTKFGNVAKATAPFLLMLVSLTTYLLMKKLSTNRKLLLYKYCFTCVMQLSLLTLYACSNYFVIKELTSEMFDLHLALTDPIPFGWLFWMFTFIIPPAYIVYGMIKKDMMLTRTGIILIAATVFTFRYYHAVLPAETAMLIGGIILIIVTYALLKYLRVPKYGFSVDKNRASKDQINLEALIITQVAGKKAPTQAAGVEFGGGSFGSGGAGGSY